MDQTIKKVLEISATTLIGFFLRDLYGLIKRILSKGNKPKLSIVYIVNHRRTFSTNPRNYEFEGLLAICNIDTENIYNINVVIGKDKQSLDNNMAIQEVLIPNDRIEKRLTTIIQHGNDGNNIEEAKSHLPDIFQKPWISVKFENKLGKKFKILKRLP